MANLSDGRRWRTATLKLDVDNDPQLREIAVELREVGYKGMSKSFLTNAMNDFLVRMYHTKGIGAVKNMIEPYHKKAVIPQ